jgi:nucleoside-diphosphate-sugar epimerase
VPDLERFTYVSTAYVAGDRRGTVYEDDHRCGRFRNSYERSKHEAEALVRASGLPWTVARPSIVVGERETGWTASFNVLYAPLRALGAGAYPVIPARRRAPLDVVPIDYVADAVVALSAHPEAVAGTFHLTAGEHASTIGEVGQMAVEGLDQHPPRLVPQRGLLPLLRHAPALRRRAVEGAARADGHRALAAAGVLRAPHGVRSRGALGPASARSRRGGRAGRRVARRARAGAQPGAARGGSACAMKRTASA